MKTKVKQLIYITGISITLITSALFYSRIISHQKLYAADSTGEVNELIRSIEKIGFKARIIESS